MPEKDRKAKWLRKAAVTGDSARIRELLAAAAPIETMDENQKTPIMLAAEAGHWDAFKVLADAGANVNHLALSQTSLLECAAAGGNLEIIQFLLNLGHPIEGHWKESDWKSKEVRRLGHLTPLNMAAINGHVEAVRVLLKAGANRNAMFDEETPLMRVKQMILLSARRQARRTERRLRSDRRTTRRQLGRTKRSTGAAEHVANEPIGLWRRPGYRCP